ncbi:MAG: CHASE4 domain-containing protein [Thermodesulfobacteriota bacterium]
MKIKYQLSIVVLVVIAVFSATEYVIQSRVVLPGFRLLEEESARTDLDRCVFAIKNEIRHMDTVANDWAAWTDTYEFVENRNQDYIDANLVDETFTDNNFNLIYILDKANRVVWGRAVDLKSMEEQRFKDFPHDAFPADSFLLPHMDDMGEYSTGVAGIVSCEKGPMLVAARPVLTSERRGPVRGTLMMGTLLTEDFVRRLSRQVRVNFTVSPPDPDLAAAVAAVKTGSIIETDPADKTLRVRTIMEGLDRKPALAVTASLTPRILDMGEKTGRYAMISGISTGLAILLLLLLFLRQRIVAPLGRLSDHLVSVAQTGNLSQRLDMDRKDEIGFVAGEFDSLMEKLERKSSQVLKVNQALKLDVARRRRVEAVLRESENYYRLILRGMHEDIYILNRDRMVTDANKPFLDTIQRDRKDVLGISCYKLFHDRDTACPDADSSCMLSAVMETGRPGGYRHLHVMPDGSQAWMEVLASPLKNEEGKIIGAILAMRDVTTEDAMEKTLRQKNKMEAIGTLAGGVAHDFNNMLMSIIPNIEFALTFMEKAGPAYHPLDLAYDASCQARDLVDKLLTFARWQDKESRPFTVEPVAAEALDIIRSTAPSSLVITSRLEAGGARVVGTPSQFFQMLVNLCTNAIKAMKDNFGQIVVSLECIDTPENPALSSGNPLPGKSVLLTVSDTGSGIDPDNLERIFEPFFTTSQPGEGTGMGLAIVHGTVQDMGGAITVQSEKGRGTTFRVYLPLHPEKADEAREDEDLNP